MIKYKSVFFGGSLPGGEIRFYVLLTIHTVVSAFGWFCSLVLVGSDSLNVKCETI